MFCEKCGAQIPDGSTFCPACGNPVVPAADPAAQRNTGYVNMGGAMPGNTGYVNTGGAMPGNTGYVNTGGNAPGGAGPAGPVYGYPAGAYPGAPAAPAVKKKKSKLPVIIGAVAGVVVIAVVAMMLLSKPYLKPIDKLFKAYNTNSLSLLQEAVSEDLYSTWNKSAVTDYKNDDSYEVMSTEHLQGEDLSNAKSWYGVTDCYNVTVQDKIYDASTGGYNTYVEVFVVGKINGKWKVVDIY